MPTQGLSVIVLNKSLDFFTIVWCSGPKRLAQQAERRQYLVALKRLDLQVLCFEEIFVQSCPEALAIKEPVADSATMVTTFCRSLSRPWARRAIAVDQAD
jgi:hypothetical protein